MGQDGGIPWTVMVYLLAPLLGAMFLWTAIIVVVLLNSF